MAVASQNRGYTASCCLDGKLEEEEEEIIIFLQALVIAKTERES